MLSINAEMDEHEDDVDKVCVELSGQELEDVYQAALKKDSAIHEKVFAELAEQKRSEVRKQTLWVFSKSE